MAFFEMRRKARGFVLVDVEPGKEREIAEKLIGYDEVKEVHVTPGEHDLMVVLEVEREIIAHPSEKMGRFVTDVISKIEGIQNTITIIPSISLAKSQE